MEDLEKKMTNTSYEDDIFDIDITSADPDEPLWDKLTQNIIEGKVIPVIGPELLMVNNVNINPAFDEAKAVDDLGIPCYVLEDGTVTLYSKDVGLEPRPQEEGASCSIDGRGC